MKSIMEAAKQQEETAQHMAEVCIEIKKATGLAEEEINEMMQASDRTTQTLAEGTEEVRELKVQAENVAETSNITVQVIERLTAQVGEVEKMVAASTEGLRTSIVSVECMGKCSEALTGIYELAQQLKPSEEEE